MKQKLQRRLGTLRAEFDTGQKALQELQAREAKLREVLLRISGAIQVLQEELAEEDESQASGGAVRAVA